MVMDTLKFLKYKQKTDMYIAHKSNVIQSFHEIEWECRKMAKGLAARKYWPWLKTVTSTDSGGNETYDFSGESYTIVECNDEDVEERIKQLNDYIVPATVGINVVYNIKYYTSKRDAEEIKDIDGNSHDPKQYVQSHFVGQDDTKDARILAEEWTRIRAERDILLAETDWMVLSDTGTISTAWKNYRKSLRDLPSDQSSETTYADITWPSKP